MALLAASKLKDYGSWVWIMQRSDTRRSEIEQMGAILLKGDAMDRTGLDNVFSGVDDIDAVVSTIGGTPANPQADSQGNINLIDAAVKKGVKKFVLITSIGTGDSKDAPPQQVYDVLKPVLLEKAKAEDHLKGLTDKLSYTIIRPGGLKSEAATNTGVLTEDVTVCGAINREDVASLLVKALFSAAADNKVLSAVDSNQLFGEPKFDAFKL